MIITFDTETRGLFGEIFLLGLYDGKEFKTVKVQDFFKVLEGYCEEETQVFAYAHNLNFDLAKIWKATGGAPIDWNKTLIINNSFVSLKLANANLFFCDSMKVFPGSLEQLSKDFNLDTPKMNLDNYMKEQGYKDKGDFFKRVPKDDPIVLEYLKCDCISLYELIQKGIDFSGLGEEEFLKCPTTPSLAMKIFKTRFKKDYDILTSQKVSAHLEEFSRKAYIGGRVEVIKPFLTKQGYHYDINSLYPYVMKVKGFPVGRYEFKENTRAEFSFRRFKKKEKYLHCIIHARVKVDEKKYIPVLPFRSDKLYFPVGIFEGYYTGEELLLAEENGTEILEIYEGVFWEKSVKVFENFVKVMEAEKTKSTGARRNFFKKIQNSLYGKFGMIKEREAYYPLSYEGKLIDKKKEYLNIDLGILGKVLLTRKTVFAKYIQPYIAAYITSYARMELFQGIKKYEGNTYYFDTDSLVLDCQMSPEFVHNSEYGKWKLEGEPVKGIFLQPKLYAEVLKTGKEVLKSKGIIKEYQEKMNFSAYEKIYQAILAGEEVFSLYENVPARRKFLMSLRLGLDVDAPVMLKKKINLRKKQKRVFNFEKNTSKPVRVLEEVGVK